MNSRCGYIRAFGLAFVMATFSHVVEAGYVSSGLASVRGENVQIDMYSGEGASVLPQRTSNRENDTEVNRNRPVDEIAIPMLANFDTSSGAAPPPPEWMGSQPVIAHQMTIGVTFRLSAWLGAEGRSVLPLPISTRIFRPPRFES